MSRTNKAVLNAVVTYSQYAIGSVSAFVTIPLILVYIGPREFGLWLTAAELIGYVALSDLGVFAILPWIIAKDEGRGDTASIRQTVAVASWLANRLAVIFLLSAGLIWWFWPGGGQVLAGPILILLLGTAISLVFRPAQALLQGLSDVAFLGILTLSASVLAVALTVGMLLCDFGLYALASAAAFPSLLIGSAAWWRARSRMPEAFTGQATWREIGRLLAEGLGGWLGGFGYRLMVAANLIVLTAAGHPEWVVIWVCTTKLPQLAQQLAWVPGDAALVGLAQLYGTGNMERCQAVVRGVLSLHWVMGTLAAVGVLLVNPSFVPFWVGQEKYAEDVLNLLVAAGLFLLTIVHSLTTLTAVVAYRQLIGLATVINGLVFLGLAWIGVNWLGLVGLGFASLIGMACTTFPIGFWAVCATYQLPHRELWVNLGLRGLLTTGLLAAAFVGGIELATWPRYVAVVGAFCGLAVAALFLRPLLADIPLSGQWLRLFQMFGLVSRRPT